MVRIGDEWRDQLDETGHAARQNDIELLCALGIRTLRYPILWEQVAPDDPRILDFSWTDARLERLHASGIRIIAGLVHHGSGPRRTNLLDPDFPAKFADYAASVAKRYPWIDLWTPINEPLTTARFSALYGLWYPHLRDHSAFLRALVHQCDATVRAMEAIRASNPRALLVQTEDLGKSFATPSLQYQADHENERRWLSLDLLCGRVGENHGWWPSLRQAGIDEKVLSRLQEDAHVPDLIGINHYLTSERFLDHRLDLYPGHVAGGNGRDAYVDAEAVRVADLADRTGLALRLGEAWERYGIPLAVTEIHHGCTRDEQLRWFREAWNAASQLRSQGMDLRAVTLWALFGNMDWRSLLTQRQGHYDVGAFDARVDPPRPTAIARMATSLASGEDYDHPVLDQPGWWRHPERFYAWSEREIGPATDGRKLLILGAHGTLGTAFTRLCAARKLAHAALGRAQADITDADQVASAIAHYRPWAVINAAGFVRATDADRERDACFAWNVEGAEILARLCAQSGLPLVTYSSDLVFDGRAGRDYLEDDPPNPLCTYGASKLEAELRVHAACPEALIVRTAAFFGPFDRHNFAWQVVDRLKRGQTIDACPRTFVSPTWVPELVHASLDLLIDGESGIRHLANDGRLSWHDFAQRVASACGLDPAPIVETLRGADRNTALATLKGRMLRPFDGALREFAELIA